MPNFCNEWNDNKGEKEESCDINRKESYNDTNGNEAIIYKKEKKFLPRNVISVLMKTGLNHNVVCIHPSRSHKDFSVHNKCFFNVSVIKKVGNSANIELTSF